MNIENIMSIIMMLIEYQTNHTSVVSKLLTDDESTMELFNPVNLTKTSNTISETV